MQCFWEQIGVLGPIYRLASRGLSDGDIADQLDLTEVTVQSCVTWILHFLQFTTRQELFLYGSNCNVIGRSPILNRIPS
jgi:DNA-binding NarL/FixJ family response regulator